MNGKVSQDHSGRTNSMTMNATADNKKMSQSTSVDLFSISMLKNYFVQK